VATEPADNYTFFYRRGNDNYEFFFVRKRIIEGKKVEFVNDRMV
jgi:hypothetical protein